MMGRCPVAHSSLFIHNDYMYTSMSQEEATLAIIRLIILFACLPIHEFCHAFAAYKLGDDTAKRNGRLTLNPLRHLDIMGSLMLLMFGFGYAKPVPVNIRNFKRPKRDFAITAIAGPASNFLLSVICVMVCKYAGAHLSSFAAFALFYAACVNMALCVFNLIPIPPLDGSRILMAFLPNAAYNKILQNERKISAGFFVAWIAISYLGLNPVWSVSSWILSLLFG